ncbi:putative colanic acid biosysnthesis UDP-glucose lipid carrier transferase [Thiothrix caldifontis]|uniref:Putative colanic acid biosysnthesis UDP-glucose lipid carrier transferase n=1 Tax=Thiothrix caldifontis TaxID=525918 RepID=A0A1H4C8E7_9GAMM|nr:undecaprenyl-phosphate glucose phosphotransferase [Thiothrix caldifontis]SEA56628.1 putative colanic acid biosysnthesis UDP-glucose lipid carrier transferase [Thiothrix caldifontis]
MENLKTNNKISAELIYRGTDTLIILGIVILASLHSSTYNIQGYLSIGLGTSLLFGLVGRFTDIYTSWSGRPFFRDEVIRLIVTWLVTFLFLIFIIFAAKTSEEFSRFVLIGWLFITPLLLISSRYALRNLQASLKRIGINNHSIAIAGITQQGLHFAQMIESQPDSGFQIAGFYHLEDNSSALQLPRHYANLGNAEAMKEAARTGEWDQIYLAPASGQSTFSLCLINELSDTITPIRLIPDDFTNSLLHSRYMEIAETPVLRIYDAPMSTQRALIKRIEDLFLGALILVLVSPMMLVIAIAIKLSSPGPVLFKQTRHGLRGEKFQVLKFRTMTVCENGGNIKQATRNDCRITRIGSFLRKTSLDELPQFFNVLQGHMSIVGPRPHAVAHNEEYRQLIPGYMRRHLMKPGITGWAQVNGWRGETDTLFKMEKRVELDMEYIRSWSLALDLRIIVVTVFKTLYDKNAY